jgi:catechol 2,3-dioxygenase-like lactoylglutathione lyase family enzyme
MRVRPIHFVPDLAEAVRFYEALGLQSQTRSRSGHWIELSAAGGEVGLHDAAIAADGQGRVGIALNFVADEPLEVVEQRLRAAGFPPEGTIVDQEWGRSLLVSAPDRTLIQIDEQDRGLYT